MNEKRLSQLVIAGAASSLLVLGLVVLVGLVIADSASSKFDLLVSPFFLKSIAVFIAYALSVYLVATAPSASRTRRLASWGFSVLFHALVIAYVAVGLGWGFVAFIPLFPEVLILGFSLWGLSLGLQKHVPA